MAAPRPGQFVMLKVPGADIFLRRPFSIYQYGRGVLSILYRVAGKGTSALSGAGRGEKVKVLGPLGNGFAPLPGHAPVIVAGGIGLAGIHLLWTKVGKKGTLFWGCATHERYGPARTDHAACAACLHHGRLLRLHGQCRRAAGAAYWRDEAAHPGIRVRAGSHVPEPCDPARRRAACLARCSWKRGWPAAWASVSAV